MPRRIARGQPPGKGLTRGGRGRGLSRPPARSTTVGPTRYPGRLVTEGLATRTPGDRFRIEREVGRGGAGIVYRAVDGLTGLPVALKIVAADAGVAPAEEERLAREGEVLRSLSHPGIVRVIASGVLEGSGQPFLAMEWLEGEDLAQRQRRQPLTLPQIVELGIRVAQALEAAH
ncbi:MAG: protein kinase, partial [Deltaproteobacteria bacterium]|nr:protein kinase [Deltaproteobacteria bacterium]